MFSGNAYFLKGESAIERIKPDFSFDWYAGRRAVAAYKINGLQTTTAQFDLSTWQGAGGIQVSWWWMVLIS